MVICLHLKHVSLGFNVYNIDISSFQNGVKHTYSSKPVSILRAKFGKVAMKCNIVMVFNFWVLFRRVYIFQAAKYYLTKYEVPNQHNFFRGGLYL